MRSVYEQKIAEATEIGGRGSPNQDRIVRPVFGAIARVLYPNNTDMHVATLGECDPRTARRYIAGEIEAPAIIYARLWVVVLERGRLPR